VPFPNISKSTSVADHHFVIRATDAIPEELEGHHSFFVKPCILMGIIMLKKVAKVRSKVNYNCALSLAKLIRDMRYTDWDHEDSIRIIDRDTAGAAAKPKE
jgi:hypothetical protein